MTDNLIFSVSQLNNHVKEILDTDPSLKFIFLSGEISNCVCHRSGHIYMTLKDEKSAIKAVMFAYSAKRLAFTPKNGMQVIALGKVSLFERDGQYQFYIEELRENGTGNVQLLFEQLKQKLEKEGLFDQSLKKKIPQFPQKIGVVTSKSGAALQDILNILTRRYSLAEVLLCDSKVQGEGAANELADGIKRLSETDCDVIIIGRGGGSIEDLWQFNDENLARAIYKCQIPVISAVGHETDFTICDFVADLRAPTPSAAAELATPDLEDISEIMHQTLSSMKGHLNGKLFSSQKKLSAILDSNILAHPESFLEQKMNHIKDYDDAIKLLIKDKISTSKTELSELTVKLDSINPLKLLSRGFSVARHGETVIKSKDDVEVGDAVTLTLADGILDCTVNAKEKR